MFKFFSILCVTFLVCTINSFSQINDNSVLLYSQIDSYQGTWSLPSYKNLSNSWSQIADDFSSNTDWIIDQIVVVGDDIDSSALDGFNIYIYDDSNGPGTLIYSAESQPYSILFLYYFYWKCTITLDIPFQLTAGNYWISVQFQSNSGTSTSWYWSQVIDNHGNTAVFRSNGTGQCASWVPVTSGICFPVGNTDMYFELYGSTVPVEVKENSIISPLTFSLEQNYPNPFNPSTTISWQSPAAGYQSIKVYDVLGNEVATLVNEYIPTGSYEVEFDASNLPSGTYFYQLKAGSFIETKKMILMK